MKFSLELVFSQNSVPVPDYENGTPLLYLDVNTPTPGGVLGAYAYTGMQDGYANGAFIISDSQCFTIPKDGYIIVSATCSYQNNAWESLFVNLAPAGTTAWRNTFLVNYTKDIGDQSFSMYIPVGKEDKIATGVQYNSNYARQILPPWCSVVYYPIKLKVASSI